MHDGRRSPCRQHARQTGTMNEGTTLHEYLLLCADKNEIAPNSRSGSITTDRDLPVRKPPSAPKTPPRRARSNRASAVRSGARDLHPIDEHRADGLAAERVGVGSDGHDAFEH